MSSPPSQARQFRDRPPRATHRRQEHLRLTKAALGVPSVIKIDRKTLIRRVCHGAHAVKRAAAPKGPPGHSGGLHLDGRCSVFAERAPRGRIRRHAVHAGQGTPAMRAVAVRISGVAHGRSILPHHARGHKNVANFQRRFQSAAETRTHHLVHACPRACIYCRTRGQSGAHSIGDHQPAPPLHHGRPRESQRPRQNLDFAENGFEASKLEWLGRHKKYGFHAAINPSGGTIRWLARTRHRPDRANSPVRGAPFRGAQTSSFSPSAPRRTALSVLSPLRWPRPC
jgi:hypothetical protein